MLIVKRTEVMFVSRKEIDPNKIPKNPIIEEYPPDIVVCTSCGLGSCDHGTDHITTVGEMLDSQNGEDTVDKENSLEDYIKDWIKPGSNGAGGRT